MTQNQINNQYMRIAKAVTKAYSAVNNHLITEAQFNSKLATADAARRTMQLAQTRLNYLNN